MCNYPAPIAANRTFAREATISSTIKSPHKHLLDDRPSGDLHIKKKLFFSAFTVLYH
jgi:hypothetical protein